MLELDMLQTIIASQLFMFREFLCFCLLSVSPKFVVHKHRLPNLYMAHFLGVNDAKLPHLRQWCQETATFARNDT
jgi:hypothetical protein